MLGKLLKHEWKVTSKLLIPINLILIVITLIGKILLSARILQNKSLSLLTGGLTALYVLIIIAITITTFIFFVIRFYRNLYGDEGYLMHTLPVSPWALLNSKLIVATIWSFITVLISIGSVLVLSISATGADIFGSMSFQEFNAVMQKEIGYSFQGLIALFTLLLLVGIIQGTLMVYASITLGQLFEKHKIVAAVLAYFVIYVIIQIVSSILLLLTNFTNIAALDGDAISSGVLSDFYHMTFSISTVENIILAIIFYIVTGMLMKKKLNID